MAVRSFFKLQGVALAGNYRFSRCIRLQRKIFKNRSFVVTQSHFCTQNTALSAGEIEVKYEKGLPTLFVPLPSRREVCQFTLRPISNTSGDFVSYLQTEDHGIDRVTAYSPEGTRIAQSTLIDILLQKNFEFVINDQKYSVNADASVKGLREHATDLGEVKTLVPQLFSTLSVEQHQLHQEKEHLSKLEELKSELEPME